jgi:hypothetical protein
MLGFANDQWSDAEALGMGDMITAIPEFEIG